MSPPDQQKFDLKAVL